MPDEDFTRRNEMTDGENNRMIEFKMNGFRYRTNGVIVEAFAVFSKTWTRTNCLPVVIAARKVYERESIEGRIRSFQTRMQRHGQ